MEKEQKKINRIIILLVIILILLIFSAITYSYHRNKISFLNENSHEALKDGETRENTGDKEDSFSNKSKNFSDENEGWKNSNSEGGKDSQLQEKYLPEDIEKKSCGFYYGEYEICGGYCEVGICVSEERSCYCKG